MNEDDIAKFIKIANQGNSGKYNHSAKTVIFLDTFKVYDTMKEAKNATSAKGAEISCCCRAKKNI